MKKLLLATCLFSQVAFAAVTVEVTGRGVTQEEAIRRAKIEAIEKVTGSFNLGHRKVQDEEYSEEINDYVSGIILESEILESYRRNQNWVVTIRAVVDETKPSKFEVHRDRPLIDDRAKAKIEEMHNRKNMIEKISQISPLHFSTNTVNVSPHISVTKISINGTVSWNQKWVNDFQNFSKYAGSKSVEKDYQSNVYYGESFYNPALITASVLLNPSRTKTKNGNTYCFAESNQIDSNKCHDIGIELDNISKYNVNYFYITLKDDKGNILKRMKHTAHNLKMVEFYPAGSSKKNNYIFFNTRNYFETDTIIIQTNNKVPVSVEFLLENSLASRVASYSIEIK